MSGPGARPGRTSAPAHVATDRFRRVLIAQPIHPTGPERLAALGFTVTELPSTEGDALATAIGDADAVIVRNIVVDERILAHAPDLKAIAVHGTGVDPIDIAAAARRGIVVFNTPGTNAESVAEHAFALLLALTRRLRPGMDALRSGDGEYRYRAPGPIDLGGRTIGLVGIGRIACATARLAHGFGMRSIGWPSPRSERSRLAAAEAGIEQAAGLDELLAGSDVISLHLPLTDETRGLLDARRLAMCRPGAFLINTARGGLVDEDALADALRSGRLAGAGLDVFANEPPPASSPLLALPTVVATPHIGGSGDGAMRRTALALADGLERLARGEDPGEVIDRSAMPDARRRILGDVGPADRG